MLKLKKGDLIGIVSPSAPISGFCPKRLNRGVEFLKQLGFEILLGENVSAINNFTAGTAQERANDINSLFASEKVKAIICTIGGYNANDILEYLDYDLIKKNNDKLLIGYSDVTILLHALHKKAGVKSIMGPMILPQFAEYPKMQDFSVESFLEVVENLGESKEYRLPIAKECTEEMLLWDQEDIRPRIMKENKPWEIVFSGQAKGRLIPANLNTLGRLIGTPYMLDLNDAVLFLEDDSEESAATIQRLFQHLKQAGLLSGIKGIIFGRFQEKSEVASEDIRFILNNVFGEVNFPVISNVDFGHTDPMVSLPLDNDVIIDTFLPEIKILL